MGRIQTSIGLMSGIPIVDTVDKLVAIARRPRDLLAAQNQTFQQQSSAITELAALLATVQFAARNLGKSDLYTRRSAQASPAELVDVAVSGSAALCSVVVRPIRLASNHQLLSTGVAASNIPLGEGRLSWRFGPHLASPVRLSLLNGGNGFVPGLLRITDRSGASANVDLTAAQTIEDVLQAINMTPGLRVLATAEGDRIRITDLSGGSGRLVVQEVTPGTAASLGLLSINTAEESALGEDILRLSPQLTLDLLNDGRGIRTLRYLPEIRYHLRDGSEGNIDLSNLLGSNRTVHTVTLGELLDYVNGLSPERFRLEISSDGDRLVFRDLTSGTAETRLEPLHDSHLLKDLGLDRPSENGVIVGGRLLGGLQTVLLTGLNGGRGLGTLGRIRLVDRSGAEAVVDLAGVETLEELLARINNSGIHVRADLNRSRTGIVLWDTTGLESGALLVASADDTQTAEKLNLAGEYTSGSVDSGDLHLQIVSENTLLSSLHGGRGVASGSFTLIDSRGLQRTISVSSSSVRTVGDLLRLVNASGLSVRAEINPMGDGIRLVDYGGGDGELRVVARSGTTAADLGLLRRSRSERLDGRNVQILDGGLTFSVEISRSDTLERLVQKINAVGGGIRASLVNDGSARPWRIVLQSEQPGKGGAVLVTENTLPLSFAELTPGQDALLALGGSPGLGGGMLLASNTNVFSQILPGLTLTVKQATGEHVHISIKTSEADVIASAKLLVDNYNRFRQKLSEYTAFDPQTGKKGVLFGDITAVRLQTELPAFFSLPLRGVGRFTSIRELGIQLQQDGSLSLDEDQLRAAYQEDPEAVRQFFADSNLGFAKKLDRLLEQLGGPGSSLLGQRIEALSRKIQWNSRRIEEWDERLRVQRERLLMQFYRLDRIVGQMQSQLGIVDRLQNLAVPALRNSR
jgi:flagellar hook-associated protein 2